MCAIAIGVLAVAVLYYITCAGVETFAPQSLFSSDDCVEAQPKFVNCT